MNMGNGISERLLLVASLLPAFFSTVGASTRTSMQYTMSSPTSQKPTPTPGPGDTDGGEGSMPEWSSLIGIGVALVGNVLISVALNLQRYAHIRIDRECEHDKLLKELYLRRANGAGRDGSDIYGTLGTDGGYRGRQQERGHALTPYRDESPDSGIADYGYQDYDNHRVPDAHDVHLQRSILSDRTLSSGELDPRLGHRKSYLRSPYWWAGIVLMTLGEAGNFLAYGFAPASIVSPLGVVALISNCVIAPIMLKEKFRKQDLWGVIVAVAGAAVVVLSAKSSEEKIGPDEIWAMITRWEFELYLGLTAGLILVLMSASNKYGSRTILIDVGLVALFGGYTALSTKGVSSLLSFTLWHAITFPITYLLVFILAFSAVMQIRYINRALQRFDSTQVIPTQFVLFTLSVIIGSAILYRDFESASAARAGKFVGGCAMTFVGVYFITSGRVRLDDDSAFSIIEDDEEEAIGLLAGERIRDSADLTRLVAPQEPGTAREPTHKTYEAPRDDDYPTPRASLISVDNDIDEIQPTPRGVLSISPPSADSSTAGSISMPSPKSLPSEQAHSLTTNPWASFPTEHQFTDSQRPSTPPDQTSTTPSATTVLLRFPSAPGHDEPATQEETQTPNNQEEPSPSEEDPPHQDDHDQTPQTPPQTRPRNSLSLRFSPGRFLPAISTGFSAVVAESLRRGETSPILKRNRNRRKRSDAVFPASESNTPREREQEQGHEQEQETGYDTDGIINDDHHTSTQSQTPVSLATARLLHSTTQANPAITAPVSATVATPVIHAPENGRNNNNSNDSNSGSNTVTTRLRSLSDSWNDGLAWLGGNLRRGNNLGQRQSISVAETRDDGDSSTIVDQQPDTVGQGPGTEVEVQVRGREQDEGKAENRQSLSRHEGNDS